MVDTVARRAQVASLAYARRKTFQKSMTHPHSRSYGNLMDLEEGAEDEMVRKDRLKFPSDHTIDSAYYQLLGNKEDTVRALRGLIRSGRYVGKKGSVVVREDEGEESRRVKGELESSLSEPDLHRGKCETLTVEMRLVLSD